MNGLARIGATFTAVQSEGRAAALMPYMVAGYPDLETSRQIARAYVDGGADLVELGIPFSDPVADGPVIHAAATAALANGITVADALSVAREIAEEVPVIVMCYVNPILARGYERFAAQLVDLGVAGVIIPDLPAPEAPEARAAFAAAGLALVPLAAPTTPDDRLQEIGSVASGFLYTVSVMGTTGERETLSNQYGSVLARARACTATPVALGFGISTPEQALEAAKSGADGVIIGSRLVRAAGESEPVETVRQLVAGFASALRGAALG